uniref:Putative secreted protein n=1 Tax=Anopheles marajoara TaxID=58244 RepID=A0A2M4CAU8_9DIPT
MYCSFVILCFTCGECRSVVSIITEKASTYTVSALAKSVLFGLQSQYREANFSISRSIFCASPGNRKPSRKWRNAATMSRSAKFIASM